MNDNNSELVKKIDFHLRAMTNGIIDLAYQCNINLLSITNSSDVA